MNTPVSFEIAKLLKEKGFDNESAHYYNEKGEMLFDAYYPSIQPTKPYVYYDNPTIAEVVMWLYEKHGIWIQIGVGNLFHKDKFYIIIKQHNVDRWDVTPLNNEKHSPYNTPTEAYEAAIEYALKELI